MKLDLSEASIVSAGQDVVSCDLAGGAALLNLRSNVYFTLNDVGSEVWGLIKEPKALADVRDAIVARYEVEPARCYDDLVAMLEQLADAGLISVTNRATG